MTGIILARVRWSSGAGDSMLSGWLRRVAFPNDFQVQNNVIRINRRYVIHVMHSARSCGATLLSLAFFFIFSANNSRAFPICCIESIEWISKYQLKKGIEKYDEYVIAILRKDKKMKVYQGQTGQPPIVSPAQQSSNFFIFFYWILLSIVVLEIDMIEARIDRWCSNARAAASGWYHF